MTERAKIFSLYGLAAICGLLAAAPDINVQSFSMLLVLITLVAAYILRARSDENSLLSHHMTFIIRTLWIYSFFTVLLSVGASYIIWRDGDASAIDSLAANIQSGIIPGENDMRQVADTYLETNHDFILQTMLMWMAPALVYLAWRIARGVSRARRNYRVQNLRSWF